MTQREKKILHFLFHRKNYDTICEAANIAQRQIARGQKLHGSVTGAIMTVVRAITLKFKTGVNEKELLNIINSLGNTHYYNKMRG